jgi:hypothetical protein
VAHQCDDLIANGYLSFGTSRFWCAAFETPYVDARSLPYLSTLQPQFVHVQPPHNISLADLGLRIIGSRAPQLGQLIPPMGPIPQRPPILLCHKKNTLPTAMSATMTRVPYEVINEIQSD